jgi:hypothetical protein
MFLNEKIRRIKVFITLGAAAQALTPSPPIIKNRTHEFHPFL